MKAGLNIVDEGILDVDDLEKGIEKSAAWAWLYTIFQGQGDAKCTLSEWNDIHTNIKNQLSTLPKITSRKALNILKKIGAVIKFSMDALSVIVVLNSTLVPITCRYRYNHATRRVFTEVFRMALIKNSSQSNFYEIPMEVAKNILQQMEANFNECEGATPANTMGMGNPSMPTDTTPGSGDLPTAKAKKRKKFKELTEGILDNNAGVDFDLMDVLFTFKKKLKKYAAMKLRNMNPLGYVGDVVDSNFNEVLKSLYKKTLKKYIKKDMPDEFLQGILCQVHIKDIYKEPIIIINWHENPNKWHQLYIRKRYPTENFLCQEQILTGRIPTAAYDEEAAYLPVIFATELAQFFKYRLTSFVSYD